MFTGIVEGIGKVKILKTIKLISQSPRGDLI